RAAVARRRHDGRGGRRVSDEDEHRGARLDFDTAELERVLEALLFLSSDPVTPAALAEATEMDVDEGLAGLEALRAHYLHQRSGAGSSCASGPRAGCSRPTRSPRTRRGGCSASPARRR